MFNLSSSRSPGYFLAAALLLASIFAPAQNRGNFYNGVRDGGRGGQYDRNDQQNRRYNNGGGRNNQGYDNRGYNNQGYDNHQGGIGPGKGALIGGAGGAILGAAFGGGLKGSIIGGAAGAGIGAVVGQAHQNSQRRNNGYNPR